MLKLRIFKKRKISKQKEYDDRFKKNVEKILKMIESE